MTFGVKCATLTVNQRPRQNPPLRGKRLCFAHSTDLNEEILALADLHGITIGAAALLAGVDPADVDWMHRVLA